MLRVRSVRCAYTTGQVLDGADLEVEDGEVVGLLGRNGMGKTSLVRCILGMTPPRVTDGSITYRGEELRGTRSHEVARHGIGLVPQGRHVFGSLTVAENLTVTARGHNGSGSWTTDRVYELFPRLGERRGQRARTLSGGEQQMLAIARALMTNPTLLVMDEASEGLAPSVLRDIRDRLLELKGSGLSVLLVEQNLGLAVALSDRLYLLGGNGRIVWGGSPDELERSPVVKREHLGV